TSIASQAVTILVTEAGTKGASAFWVISSLPLSLTTSTSPEGASAATFSLAPAKAWAGSRSTAQTRASRREVIVKNSPKPAPSYELYVKDRVGRSSVIRQSV